MPSKSPVERDWAFDRSTGDLSQQLAGVIRDLVASGKLQRGDRLPASRALARDLSLARGTVMTALEILIAEGLLEAKVGAGTFVACDPQDLRPSQSPHPPREYPFRQGLATPDVDGVSAGSLDLRAGRPSLEAFPLNIWRRCLSAAASAVPSSDYGEAMGLLELRQAVVDYLRRARGLVTTIDLVIITNGTVHAMHLLARLFLDESRCVAVESPGYPLARQTLASTGARVLCGRVDDDGLVVSDIIEPPSASLMVPQVVYVTPSHQFPFGSRLSFNRRKQLIDWAERKDGLIIEDDYDGEFRYDVAPLPPLASLGAPHVVYCGTFSKTMFPGLRLGFAVAPKSIASAMGDTRAITEYAPCSVTQRALAMFIESGDYERHILRMRRIYAAKRKALVQAFRNHAAVTGLESGLSAVVRLPDRCPSEQVAQRLSDKGILIQPLSRYVFDDRPSINALVFGYAALSQSELEKGVNAILEELAR